MTDSNTRIINKTNVSNTENVKTDKPRSMLELIRSKMHGGSKSKYDDII